MCEISNFLINQDIKQGDRVLIYMPMIPEAIFAMIACNRIGAVHVVTFGGFAAPELSKRIECSKPKLIITASAGLEPNKIIHYLPIIEKALKLLNATVPILMVQRSEVYSQPLSLSEHKIFTYQDEVQIASKFTPAVPVHSNHPLYIIYTSGSTSDPKGIIRDTGGTCVALNFSMRSIMGINARETYFSSSDIGWVVGHSYIVYGPLLRGGTTVLFEGKPIGMPDSGKIWSIIERHKVKSIFTSPTAIRAVRKEDPNHLLQKKYNLSSLHSFHLAGERCDIDTFKWVQDAVKEHDIIVNDNWWQTETGWPITSNNLEYHNFKCKPGSACRAAPGYDIRIIDDNGHEKKTGDIGKIVIKLPMPPSFMVGLWGKNMNEDVFKNKYLTKDNQYYITGDAGYIDDDQYLHIMSRIDDIINVAGHRLSTGNMEEILIKSKGIVEAAVVSVKDDIKGEVPFAFVVLYSDIPKTQYEELKRLGKEKIVSDIGPIAKLKDIVIVQRLPKTKSGKVLRSVLKSILNGESYRYPSTIEDPVVLTEITELLKSLFFMTE